MLVGQTFGTQLIRDPNLGVINRAKQGIHRIINRTSSIEGGDLLPDIFDDAPDTSAR